jgi:predicted amidohydrolase
MGEKSVLSVDRLKICGVQFNISLGNAEKNIKVVEKFLTGMENKAGLAVLPELWYTGFDYKNLQNHAKRSDYFIDLVRGWCQKFGMSFLSTFLTWDGKKNGVYNTLYLIDENGNICGKYSKMYLFQPMGEDTHFLRGDKNQKNIFSFKGWNIATAICYELRFPEIMRKAALDGAELGIIPTEWPDVRLDHWLSLTRARAIENEMYVMGVNACGKTGKWNMAGHSVVYDPWGNVISLLDDKEGMIFAEIDKKNIRQMRKNIPSVNDASKFKFFLNQ